jgi:amidase
MDGTNLATTGISRRKLLRSGLVTGMALAGSPLLPQLAGATGRRPASGAFAGDLLEATVLDLQDAMAHSRLSSAEITQFYLDRIAELNPVLGAVIQTNPDAIAIACERDAERRQGRVCSPLHGIPVLLKDNIATDDSMETTAGSLALVGSRVPHDALIVDRLRKAGAVVLGKANLSEWANFRGFGAINGWSARGGFTRSPYDLSFDPTGSSSGSAVGTAANLTAIAVGTETDGSITAPAAEAAVVGMKPSVGLVSQKGIIPIAHSQDTAGPLCRTVTDAALLLNVLRSPFGEARGHRLPRDYTAFLDARALKGVRLAYDHRYVEGDLGPGDADLLAVVDQALSKMRAGGAVIDDITTTDPRTPTADGRVPFDDEFTVLLFEFKVQVAEYLKRLRHTSERTLADLIAFNLAHCEEEMRFFGQEVFEMAEATSGDLTDPEYLAAWRTNRGFGRSVIDGALAQGYDAVLTPSFSFGTSNPAIAGYPSIAVPVGLTAASRPVGLWMAAGFLQEPTLLGLAYATEQLLHGRKPPQLLGSPPPEPPDAGICAAPAATQAVTHSVAAVRADRVRRRVL